ncbi:hypothetical protein [Peribacillus huizhouensis]|uniref:Uncharacterized protein n=1 Tax=Peribacillus huizhouensis TaxID=1501239 RepID=A0ABR6CSD5_9BACI|nr:hypothetical protein [Peribacillus huizhouensis]MBA9027568.1 hypothetical protein [Peribacillus huizhouensis]
MKKYTVRPHAVDRALLRFGISSEHAENWFNQLLMNARLLGTQGGQQYYDHKGKRIVVQGTEVVTILVAEDLPFGKKISVIVERELRRAERELKKKERELSIKIAEATIEQATLTLNQLKAKSPSIKAKIQKKLDVVTEAISELGLTLERERDEYNHTAINSRGYLIHEAGKC